MPNRDRVIKRGLSERRRQGITDDLRENQAPVDLQRQQKERHVPRIRRATEIPGRAANKER